MLVRGAELFFELTVPEGAQGSRERCVVVQASEDTARLRFVETSPLLSVGDRGRAYFEGEQGFGSREVSVREVDPDCGECLIRLIGEMQPAPTREFYRVPVAEMDLWCGFGGEKCRISTLSPGGLGVLSQRGHGIGALVELVLYSGVQSDLGRVRVVNRAAVEGGETLYGLRLAPAVLDDGSRLAEALARLTAEVQRLKLRRERQD